MGDSSNPEVLPEDDETPLEDSGFIFPDMFPQDEGKPSGMSDFAWKIKKITMESGDFISEETMNELEEMFVSNQEVPQTTPPGALITDEHRKTFSKVCNGIKAVVEAGSFVSKNFKEFLGPIGQAAGIVKGLIDLFDDKSEETNPVKKELGELRDQINALSDKMTVHFNDLKAFQSEQQFYRDYSHKTSTLDMFLQDVLVAPSKKSLDKFLDTYKTTNPQYLVYNLMVRLKDDRSNPLKMGMTGDHLQTTVTFKKWRDNLSDVFTQALLLEVFAAGFDSSIGTDGIDKITAQIGVYRQHAKDWDAHYLTKARDYWPKGVKKLVDDVIDNRSLDSKEKKIEEVWKNINLIQTLDKFYAIVFKNEEIYKCYRRNDSQAVVADREGYVIIVYHAIPNKTTIERKKFIKEYMDGRFRFVVYEQIMRKAWNVVRRFYTQERFDDYGNATGDFFLGVAQSEGNIALKYHDVEGWNHGSGYFKFDAKLRVIGWGTTDFPVFYMCGA